MKSTLSSLFVSIVIACFLTQGNLAAQIPQSALDAQKVLKQHCYKCHGENGVAVAGLNVLNWKQLTGADGFIVPKDVGESSLYDYIDGGGMPPEDDDRVKVMPTEDEIRVIKDWILAGAPDFEQEIVREFISPEKMVGFIENDLRNKVAARERKHMRYFTLTHLYNANIPDAEIDTYRLAISKLINSLSWNRDIVIPVAIDPKETVYRIDLRDYDWDLRHDSQGPPVWDTIVAQSPYNVEYSFTAANYCSTATSHALPFVRGDWFVAAASRPPLYHQILEIPENVIALEKRLGVDVSGNIKREKVTRAAFIRSGVSDNNRLIERHDSVHGAYWISYDFAGNQGRQLLTSHPLGPGDDPSDFKHDGGEVIFNLPNGLQAYMLITADGTRIDKGPTNIVKDPDDIARDGGAVVNGISCMHCHDQGMKLKDDEIRLFVNANPVAFGNDPVVIGAINALYPVQPTINKLYANDARRHIEAAEKTGSPVVQVAAGVQLKLVDGKPVVRLSTQFHNELNLEIAAAEAGVKQEVFIAIIDQSQSLAAQLGILKLPGKTVKRDTYVAAYANIVKELRLGRYVPSKNRPAIIFANKPVKIGVLHSLTGTMALSEASLVDAVQLAVSEINAAGGVLGREIEPVIVDPASDWDLFAEKAKELIVTEQVAVTFGCWTSVSRKSVLPVFEGENALLFFPVQYEGEEQSLNVFYTAATPNQQLIPAAQYMMSEAGGSCKKFYLLGTDYVFPRTANKVLKAFLQSEGVADENIIEEYTPFHQQDYQTIVGKIKEFAASGDACILSTINGDSNVPFYKEFANQGLSSVDCPIMAFSVAEDELRAMDVLPLVGHLAAWNYFQSINTPENLKFVNAFKAKFGADRVTDDPIEAAYFGVYVWAAAAEKAGSFDVDLVREAVYGMEFDAPGGPKKMHKSNQHTLKPVYIGEILADGQFRIVHKSDGLVSPDSYSSYLHANGKYPAPTGGPK